jgi:endonuclease V-like protein UPF0215 family
MSEEKLMVIEFWHKGRDDAKFVLLSDFVKQQQKINSLEAELEHERRRSEKLLKVVEMVEDNRKMPHKHLDYFERLCCLTERAQEALKEYRSE